MGSRKMHPENGFDISANASGFLEKRHKSIAPKIEYRFKFLPDYERVRQPSERPECKTIVYCIRDFDATSRRHEKMLVMPEPVGTETLFVNEITVFFKMGDLGNPCKRDACKRLNPIGYHHTRKHFPAIGGNNLKIQPWGRDPRKVARRGKKFPGGLDGGRQYLRSADAI